MVLSRSAMALFKHSNPHLRSPRIYMGRWPGQNGGISDWALKMLRAGLPGTLCSHKNYGWLMGWDLLWYVLGIEDWVSKFARKTLFVRCLWVVGGTVSSTVLGYEDTVTITGSRRTLCLYSWWQVLGWVLRWHWVLNIVYASL